MTNLQEGSKPISPVLLRRLWLYTPIALGGVVAALLAATVLVPQWMVVQQDLKRRSELQSLRDEVLQGKVRLKGMVIQEEKARSSQEKLFEIVTGNGDLTTFMAMVDREANLAGVQVDLYEPQQPPEPAPGATPGAPATQRGLGPSQAPAPGSAGQPNPAGGLEKKIPGLTSRSILVSARGSYPSLLAFLRRLELLKVLVVQSDLRLLFEDKPAATPQERATQAENTRPVQLKVLVSLYGRDPAAQARGTPTPGAPPGAAPAAAAPPPPVPPAAPAAPAPAAPAPAR